MLVRLICDLNSKKSDNPGKISAPLKIFWKRAWTTQNCWKISWEVSLTYSLPLPPPPNKLISVCHLYLKNFFTNFESTLLLRVRLYSSSSSLRDFEVQSSSYYEIMVKLAWICKPQNATLRRFEDFRTRGCELYSAFESELFNEAKAKILRTMGNRRLTVVINLDFLVLSQHT